MIVHTMVNCNTHRTEVVFVCILVSNGLMIEIYGFAHSLLAYAIHGAILTENSEDRR